MKKLVLLFTGMLMGLATVSAAEKRSASQSTDLDLTSRYRYAQPILFVERGVEFLIFADGSFDFNTDLSSTTPNDNTYYYRRSSVRSGRNTNTTYGAPGMSFNNNNRGVLVTHDQLGRVRRIGNVFINYDQQGKIKRVGSVYMTYRNGQLAQVGGLRMLYNRQGDVIGTRGFVNHNNQSCNICGISGCRIDHYGGPSYNNDWNNENDHYYYRKDQDSLKKDKIKD